MDISSDKDLLFLVQEGLEKISDTVKIQIHTTDPEFFSLLDFYNDSIFLDPHLIATLGSLKFRNSPMSFRQKLLRPLLFGYIDDPNKPSALHSFTDNTGVLYLPRVGYYTTALPDAEVEFQWKGSAQTSRLAVNGQIIQSSFSPLVTLSENEIELCQAQDRSMREFFRAWENDQLTQGGFTVVEIDKTELQHRVHPQIKKAFDILQYTSPDYNACVRAVCKKILVFHNTKVRSFASAVAMGMSFFSFKKEDDEVFLLSEIIHQFGHNILYAIIHTKADFFKIDADTPLSTLNGNIQDHRTLFSAYHGLFTTTQTAVCLEQIIDQNIFEGKQEHELIGRFVDNSRRFRTGLERCNLNEILTENGLKLYHYLDRLCEEVHKRKEEILRQFNIRNQPFVFDYGKFAEANPLPSK
jgi:hypothetical protein